MGFFQHPVFYASLMVVAGLGIPIMAALNGNLGSKLGSPALATTILFLVGGMVSLAFLFVSGGLPKSTIKESIPVFFYFGGLFVIFYILSITWTAPKFGVGNSITMVLLGQLVSIAIIDHFGLLGALKHTITVQRLAGLAFMMLGAFLIIRRF